MSANFIFEEPDKIRATSFSSTSQYDINTLNFYISNYFGADNQIFMILKNNSGLYDIVELARVSKTNQAILYKLPINQSLRVGNEKVNLSLLVLYPNGLYYISPMITVHINTDNYKLARQVYITQEVGSVVQNCYAQILALTDQNVAIYNKIVEREDEYSASKL